MRHVSATTKLVIAAVTAAFVFAGVYGFAASLGISAGGLGAGDNLMTSCGNGMTFAYSTAFDPEISADVVTGIDLSNVPAGCLDKTLSVNFTNSANEAVGSPISATLSASGTTQVIPVARSSNVIDARQIDSISVVVSS